MKYRSPYSPGKDISCHQYIVELVCENRAHKLKRDLPIKFWELSEWRNYYVLQSKICGELRKKFYDESILRAVRSHKLYDLRPKWIEQAISKFQSTINNEVKEIHSAAKVEVIENPKTPERITKKSVIDKLKELE